MNILFYEYSKFSNSTAPFVHVSELSANWLKLGHKVIFIGGGQITCGHGGNTKPPPWKRLRRYMVLSAVIYYLVVELYKLLQAISTILRRKTKPDVIYTRHYFLGSAYLLAKLLRVPLIKEINGIIADEMKAGKEDNRFFLALVAKIDKFTLPKADKIIAVASKLKEVLHSDYNIPEDRMVVIRNGVNTELFRPIPADEARKELNLDCHECNYVCFVGNLWLPQGVQYLIQAAPIILEKHPDTRFLIVGDGLVRENLINLAQQIGVSSKVTFTGMVAYEEVPFYINASDVCVVPSVRERNERGGLSPLKLYEYAACGKPVVASRINGLEVLEHNNAGILVEPENPLELANAVTKLLQVPELRKQMGENGREYVVQNHSWESVAKRVAEVCRQVAGKDNV